MKNQIGKSFGRYVSRSRLNRLRKLDMESLEGRRLMAADFSPYHNDLIAEDVNQDFRVSPSDALAVINRLNSRSSAAGESGSGTDTAKWDVSGDGYLSPIDALLIINRLNGEGEGDILMRYSYSITDPTTGNAVTQVAVGSDFLVNVFVQDARDMATRPTNNDGNIVAGVFTAAMDLGVSTLSLANFVHGTTFRSGIQYVTSNFSTQKEGFEGGGILLGTGNLPTVNDGDTFSVTVGSNTVTFEFDNNLSTNATNVGITIPSSGTATFSTVGNAIVTAINGSSLGITARYNGDTVVVLPQTATFDPGTSSLQQSLIQTDYFDEIRALSASTFDPPADPGAVKGFYSVRFTATAAGTLTFTPNAPDTPSSENGLYSTTSEPNPAPTPLPDSLIDFGSPFSITIITDPTGPRVVNDTLSTNEDVALAISNATLLSNDSSGATPARTLSVSSIQTISGTTQGTLSGGVYTPPANFNGQDLLTYTVTDTAGLSATGTITINVAAVNDAPTATADSLTAVLGVSNTLDVLANDSPGPANESSQTLTVISTSTPANGTIQIASDGKSVVYTPRTGFIGSDSFTYTIQDSGNPALTATATVTLNVIPPTRPFAINDTATVNEDSSNNTITVLTNDLVNTGETAQLVAIVSNPANGTAVVNGSSVQYTPNANFFGTDTFTYSMNESNGTGANSVGTVVVTVTNVNDAPTLVNDTAQAAENEVRTIPFADLLANDSAGPGESSVQTLTITSVSAITAGAGTVAISGTNVVYTPAPSFSGTFQFTYNATDNGSPALSAAVPATVTVEVTPFNDPPALQNDTASGTEDGNVTIALSTLLSNDSPGPGESSQTLTVNSVAAVTANAGTVQIVGANVVYTPAADFNGPFLFTYTATDNGFPAKSGTATVTVNMAAVNDAPVVGADTVRAFKNNPLRLPISQVLSNDSTGPANESSQTLTVIAVQSAVNGTVQLDSANGVIIFTPAADFTGTASFQYTVQDNGGGTNTTTGTVTVNVEEFLPSSIGGTVWVDETKDGLITNRERFLDGVRVTLTGTSLGQTIAPQTALTLADGTYQFAELGPGSYQISFDRPMYTVASSFYTTETYSIDIPEPGGFDNVQNFSVFGVNPVMATRLGRLMDQLVSNYHYADASISFRGAYFAIGSDNSMMWGLKLDGFEDALYTEAVMDGDHLLLTVVDANHALHTARVSSEYFAFLEDEAGNLLVRLIGSAANFSWASTSLAAPAYTAENYLASVDELFAQRGW